MRMMLEGGQTAAALDDSSLYYGLSKTRWVALVDAPTRHLHLSRAVRTIAGSYCTCACER